MSAPTIETQTQVASVEGQGGGFDPFDLDIAFIEGTPAADTVLMCGTGDTCGSSCPSACTTS
ncbi:FxLD family lantipeptide [Sinosporangium album]|uniref:FxLD family lantipeptide n=1 Tax=Sinosporangium album TaxID=504805 RepID=A0A1G7U1G8_9ACTN|nr:FxLD family lanthipeptide [Sinosporangium album]SDG41257.1 FxLD family lantipeptide [Sinosporangium album]